MPPPSFCLSLPRAVRARVTAARASALQAVPGVNLSKLVAALGKLRLWPGDAGVGGGGQALPAPHDGQGSQLHPQG